MGLPADFRAEADERYRALLESAPDAMVIVDDTGIIRLVNAQTELMFGYSRDDLVGRTVEFLVPRRFRQEHLGSRDGYIASPQVRPMGPGMERIGLRSDGTEFPVEISLSPLETERRPARVRRGARRQRPQGRRGAHQPARADRRVLPGRHPDHHPGRRDHLLEHGRRAHVRLPRGRGNRTAGVRAGAAGSADSGRRDSGAHRAGRADRALRRPADDPDRQAAGRGHRPVAGAHALGRDRRRLRDRAGYHRAQTGQARTHPSLRAAAPGRADPAAQPDGIAARDSRHPDGQPVSARHPGSGGRRRLVRPHPAGGRAGGRAHR